MQNFCMSVRSSVYVCLSAGCKSDIILSLSGGILIGFWGNLTAARPPPANQPTNHQDPNCPSSLTSISVSQPVKGFQFFSSICPSVCKSVLFLFYVVSCSQFCIFSLVFIFLLFHCFNPSSIWIYEIISLAVHLQITPQLFARKATSFVSFYQFA